MIGKKVKVKDTEEEFDLKKFIGPLLDHWKLFAIAIAICLLLGFLYLQYTPKQFMVHAKMLVQEDRKGNSSLFSGSGPISDIGDLLDVPNNVNNELAILQTNDMAEKVVRAMNLNIQYFKKNTLTSSEIYKTNPYTVHFISLSDSLRTASFDFVSNPSNPSVFTITNTALDTSFTARFNDTINSLAGKFYIEKTDIPFGDDSYFFTVSSIPVAISALQNSLDVQIGNKETTVINLNISTTIPSKGEDILARLIQEYLKGNLEQKNIISDSTISFINSRIGLVSSDLASIEKNVQGFKQQNNLADINEQSRVLISNSSDYTDKLNQVEVQLNVLETMLNYMQDGQNNNRPVPSLVTNDPNFLALLQQYNNLVLQRSRVGLSSTDNNPFAKNLDAQIQNLRGDLIKSLLNQKKSLTISRDQLLAQNKLIKGEVHKVPGLEREYLDLNRQQNIKEQLYIYLLQKKEETAITKASNIPSASVIDRPKAEVNAYFPSKMMILGISVFAGIGFPFLYMILKLALNNKVLSRKDVEEITDIPIVAEISHTNTAGNMLIVNRQSRSVIAEQFRSFRTNLQYIGAEQVCPIYLITSSMSGEGKSFIATNLAQICALSGKKVLLMEMDLRKPKITEGLEMDNSTGFSNYIISDISLNDIIKPLNIDSNVHLISSGPIPPNPSELLLKPKVARMFTELKSRYDLIIIDSPPLGMVTDTQILAEHSDVNLFVIRQKYTFKGQIELLDSVIESSSFKNMYIVINDVVAGISSKYGYGYSYGYGYGYGYEENGLSKKEKKRKLKKLDV